jgi:hypothetical protein
MKFMENNNKMFRDLEIFIFFVEMDHVFEVKMCIKMNNNIFMDFSLYC